MRYNAPARDSRRDLERILDALTRKIVLAQEFKCFTCDAFEGLDWGHLFTRTWRPTRWDVARDGNNHAQCWPCNSLHEEEPHHYTDKFIETFGEPAYDALDARAHSHHKFTIIELHDMIAERAALLERLQNGSN
jgi:hypothetical protein